MKKHLTVIMLIALAFLVSCANGSDNTDRVNLLDGIGVAYNDIIIYNGVNGVIYALDLTTQANAPLCVRPNCAHTDDSCSARAVSAKMLTVYQDSLFMLCDEEEYVALYKCGMDGGDRRRIFTMETSSRTDNAYYLMSVSSVKQLDGKLYFVVKTIVHEENDGVIAQSELVKLDVFCYDFTANKKTAIYQTELPNGIMNLLSVSKKAISYSLFYDDAHGDLTCEYGYISLNDGESVAVNTTTGSTVSSANNIYVSGDYCYYIGDGDLYRLDIDTRGKQVVFEGALDMFLADNTVFVYTKQDWANNEFELSYLKNEKWVRVSDDTEQKQIFGETENYFIVSSDYSNYEPWNPAIILKTEYYN
ncbi:MAG: hypothetical protein LBI36_03155, partial [Oscillospiraceae bacterium]|nr:hypothetical protein [Oscillospiraceae bacterium]